MLSDKQLEILKKIAQELNRTKIDWVLIGSSNLALQGMDFSPNDIDIMVPYKDKDIIKKLFNDYQIIKEEVLPNKEAEEVKYLIDDIAVEICFEYDNGFYFFQLRKTKKEIKIFDNINISCLPLEAELNCYRYLGRDAKANLIQDFIKNF